MSIEITDDTSETSPPPVVVEAPKNGKETKDAKAKKGKEADEPETDDAPRAKALTPEMKDLRRQEDLTLKEVIEGLGDEGHFKIRVTRQEPEYAKDATGKQVPTSGFLDWVHKSIDETWLKDKYGGGKYEIYFRKRGSKGGWEYGGQRTVVIPGEPNLAELPRSVETGPSAIAPPVTSSEPGPMAKHALDLMAKQLDKAEARADANTGDGGNSLMIELLREELRESRRQFDELRKEMRETANRPAPVSTEDRVKDTLLNKLMDQDSARLQAVRAQYESELRMAKEAAIETEKRLYDRFERDRQSMENTHKREIDLLNTAHASSLAAAKSSFEVSLQAAKSSFDTQKEIMSAENRRIDRDNTDLRTDVKDLRAKKEKTIVEQFKEIQTVKDAIGIEDEGERGTGEKIVDALTNPDVIAAAGKFFGKGEGGIRGGGTAPAATEEAKPKSRVVQDGDGNKFILSPDGRTLRAARKKPAPGSPQALDPSLPNIDPEVVNQVVGFLERAFTAGTDPDIVAQSGKAMVPDAVLMAIRDVGGVDAFLSKVARLPGSSPLSSSQAGRNWVRKVGKALVGE